MPPIRRISAIALVFLYFQSIPSYAQQLETAAQEIANQISLSLVAEDKKMVALMPFTNLKDQITEIGEMFAEELLNKLFLLRQGRFDIVERKKIPAITKEMVEFPDQFYIDNLAGFSQVLGADAILVGTIFDLEGYSKVNARLISVPSGELLAAASSRMQSTPGRPVGIVEIQRPCPINNTFQCAALLPFDVQDKDTFRDVHDSRYYAFQIDQTGKVKLTLKPMPNSRFVTVIVYSDDDNYTKIAQKYFDAGRPGTFEVALRAAGRYYVELEPGSCCSGAPYDYGFSVSR